MIATFAGLALLAAQAAPPEAAWTWTLYADEARVALAHEVPDTANLRFTLECDPASGVARVTFDRPEARNAMTWAMYERLHAICERLRDDPAVRVVRFQGAGGPVPCRALQPVLTGEVWLFGRIASGMRFLKAER